MVARKQWEKEASRGAGGVEEKGTKFILFF